MHCNLLEVEAVGKQSLWDSSETFGDNSLFDSRLIQEVGAYLSDVFRETERFESAAAKHLVAECCNRVGKFNFCESKRIEERIGIDLFEGFGNTWSGSSWQSWNALTPINSTTGDKVKFLSLKHSLNAPLAYSVIFEPPVTVSSSEHSAKEEALIYYLN